MKRLDRKLETIRAGRYRPTDFVIADAKDADMSFGLSATGLELDDTGQPTGRLKPYAAYRDDMLRVIGSDLVDIMLTSLSTCERLTEAGAFENTEITPAIRLNDSSDIWVARGGTYKSVAPAPFRTPRLDRVKPICDLGLYAISFYNDLELDRRVLEHYAAFRDEASAAGVRHFLEVFNPQIPVATGDAEFAAFNNDAITRCLAGVSRHDAPLFLKAAYNGPRACEELASYDPERIIVGILGGAAGTNRDTLELIKQAEAHGARVALFGRKVYFSESSVDILRAMRLVIEEGISSEEATKQYHEWLRAKGIRAHRSLEDDLEITDEIVRDGMKA